MVVGAGTVVDVVDGVVDVVVLVELVVVVVLVELVVVVVLVELVVVDAFTMMSPNSFTCRSEYVARVRYPSTVR